MKRTISLFILFFFLLFTGKAFSAGITVTGETMVNSSTNFTYYATPQTPGSGYTWHIYGGTIVSQNTDPGAGALYCVVRWDSFLGEGGVEITDGQGNSGLLFTTVFGFTNAAKQQATIDLPVQRSGFDDRIKW